jgi:hypothetical protein
MAWGMRLLQGRFVHTTAPAVCSSCIHLSVHAELTHYRAEHAQTASQELEGIHKQLQLIEGTLQKLNMSVDTLSRLGNSSETRGLGQNTSHDGMSKCMPTTETDLGHQPLTVRLQQPASQTTTWEEAIVFSASPSSSVEHLLASARLRDVTNPIWTLGLDTNQSFSSEPAETTCDFFVPSDAIGSVLINRMGFQIALPFKDMC